MVDLKKPVFYLRCLFCILAIFQFPIYGNAASLNKVLSFNEAEINEERKCAIILAHADAVGVVKDRMTLMKSYARSMKSLSAALGSFSREDLQSIKDIVDKMVKGSSRLLSLFPVGSGGGVSEASPRIWKEPDDFAKTIRTFTQALQKLVEATNVNSKKAVMRSFREVGRSCKNCHQDYREKK